ncbi:MAG TPA: Tad domain-containing protein [Nocardioidaceae bacterium]|nr:Tad domain-containing protein [Nocardioidaceae bacterium]
MAVLVALSMVALCIAAAFVIDVGKVRVDQQQNKSAADSAAIAGVNGLVASAANGLNPYTGVCEALQYYVASSGITFTSKTWSDGSGDPLLPDPDVVCSSLTSYQESATCQADTPSKWVRFTGVSTDGKTTVRIQSGYEVNTGDWAEDSLPALAADPGAATYGGCDQVGVLVGETQPTTLGALATTRLASAVRSVGRYHIGPGGNAPAMLLLKRTGCPVLSTGSNSGGSRIRVFGKVSTDGSTSQPGTIHADSNGSGCSGGSNANIFLGKAADGIVAFGDPKTGDPGQITSVAAANGFGQGVGYDADANVFGTTAIDDAGLPGTATPPSGHDLVTRSPVDDRYFTAVKGAISTAESTVFSTLDAGNAAAKGYIVISNCSPTAAQLTAKGVTSTSRVFVDCTANSGFTGSAPIVATTVVFNGAVKPGGNLALPNATHVYVFGDPGNDAMSIGNGSGFSMHGNGNTASSVCSNAQSGASTDKAVLVIRDGDLKQTGGSLQLCYTTVIAMGGQPDGCVPSTSGTAPTQTPCAGDTGDGQLSQTGGNVDWTAPNALDATTDVDGNPLPAAETAWADPDGPEDLAFWSESYGGNSNPTYNMNGQGLLHVVGVYMTPNADPFTIGGGAAQTLSNAQYISSSIALNGAGTSISMTVDPNAAVTIPPPDFFLVR